MRSAGREEALFAIIKKLTPGVSASGLAFR
jgi:hypothetical protein